MDPYDSPLKVPHSSPTNPFLDSLLKSSQLKLYSREKIQPTFAVKQKLRREPGLGG